ncbi:unnamed protein product [Rotaria socialis]|uniref:F-box domain-containing protein n=1 Tax=Rotaria socialis TaxID=392032 RepID=A0A820Q2L9_9BILA|nr:unnamed protein product [Rotaria socialis]
MSDKKDLCLLALPIEVIFHILDELDEFTIIFYVRNVCTQLKTITDTYYEYQSFTELAIEDRNLDEEKMQFLAQSLKDNTLVKTLILAWNRFYGVGIQYLTDAIKINRTLTTLDFRSNAIGDHEAQSIGNILLVNTTLMTLHLHTNEMSNRGIHYLANALEHNTTLTTLSLYNNKINIQSSTYLANVLQNNTTITMLYLCNNKLGAQETKHLADGLKTNRTVQELHIVDNEINNLGTKYLADALENNSTLTILDLENNSIRDEGIQYLAKIFKNNTTLTTLDLGNNTIGFNGIKYLTDSLQEDTALSILNLYNNYIGSTGARYLAKILRINKVKLTVLHLGSNHIGIEGISDLAIAIGNNTTLTSLNLERNQLLSEGAKYLADALKTNTTLVTLHLGENNIGDAGIECLAQALKINNTLTTLTLDHNRIQFQGAFDFANALQNNKTLKSLDLDYKEMVAEEAQYFARTSRKIKTLTTLLSYHIQADTCNTYNHPQYGIGQCINQSECPNALYLSGLCESKPSNIQCCFSVEPMKEEFRAIWIATVTNIDWPSSGTASPAQQQSELLDILNKVQELNMNAVVFQVRPASDALYFSALEPWSYYLTGKHGVAPSPFWDPLAFIVNEAHKRNIEVHAWLNPYRARTAGATYALASTNMAKRFPQYAYTYGQYIWMDPGATEVQQFTVNVTEDIVTRYAVDGIHIDDYFYPYSDGTEFPDAATYAAYQAQGGHLNKSDWRRSNVNTLIQSMYTRIHAVRPKVKFGISPFGIWKSGIPAGISGLSSYDELYCDSRMWLEEGLLDYMTPQLYWAIDPPAQSYPVLLNWWLQQSAKGRHVYAGNAAYKMTQGTVQWDAHEIVRQINITRSMQDRLALGNVFFSTKEIMRNAKGIQSELAILYKKKAIIPKMKWL